MIETQEAVDNINDILDVDGLDGAFVGKQKIIILSYISMCDATFEAVSFHMTLQRRSMVGQPF